MKTLGNIIWYFPFMGFISALGVWFVALLWACTIIGMPIAQGLFEFGKFLLKPFGQEMVSASEVGKVNTTNRTYQTYSKILGIIWIVLFGWWMTIIAILQIAGLFISIIGIPVATVMAKSIKVYMNPVGKICVSSLLKEEIERGNIRKSINA